MRNSWGCKETDDEIFMKLMKLPKISKNPTLPGSERLRAPCVAPAGLRPGVLECSRALQPRLLWRCGVHHRACGLGGATPETQHHRVYRTCLQDFLQPTFPSPFGEHGLRRSFRARPKSPPGGSMGQPTSSACWKGGSNSSQIPKK